MHKINILKTLYDFFGADKNQKKTFILSVQHFAF